MDDATAKGFSIWDNKSGEFSEWDMDLLNIEIESLMDDDFDISLTGFNIDEFETPDFQPGNEDDQGKLDELEPKMVTCPHCGGEFDTRKA